MSDDYIRYLYFQLQQILDIAETKKEDDLEWVKTEIHDKWTSFFKYFGERRKEIVRLMLPEDVVKYIDVVGRYVEDMTKIAKALPAKTVIANWDTLVVKYNADKDECFNYVKNEISYDSLKEWVKRGIELEKLYNLFKSSSFVTPDYGASNYYNFMKTLKGLDKTPAWEDVKQDLPKYKGAKYVFIDIVEDSGKWKELGFEPSDYLKEYYKAKSFDLMTLGPKNSICKYVSMNQFMETVDFVWLINYYAERNVQWFWSFVGDYDEIYGSTDKLTKRFIEEIGYISEYWALLWELLLYDKGRNLDMERIARLVAVHAKSKDHKAYMEALSKMGMPKEKLKDIFGK